jgi:hypothetical protein
VADLPRADRNAPEVAGQARPVFLSIERSAGAGNQMQTPRSVRAFVAKRTGGTNVTGIEQPHARERQSLVDESLDEELEQDIERSLLGECK